RRGEPGQLGRPAAQFCGRGGRHRHRDTRPQRPRRVRRHRLRRHDRARRQVGGLAAVLMTFLWPSLLWFLLALPVCVAAYLLILRRKKLHAVRYASLSLIKDALGNGQAWRRHLPPAILLVALGAMIAAMARPAALITLPSQHETVILAIDVSASMRADDVQPTRIVAAQAA